MYTSKTDGRERYQRAEQDSGKLLLLCHVPFCKKSTAFCKVPRFRPFVLLVTVTG
jgi:coproporphyrinogen III oxidase-like Fe-S oxidoreductase